MQALHPSLRHTKLSDSADKESEEPEPEARASEDDHERRKQGVRVRQKNHFWKRYY